MPPPLSDKRVEYTDGAPMTVEQYAKDISAFLMWTAEPHLEARKRLGLQVVIFIVLAGLLYFTKKKVWHEVELHPRSSRRARRRNIRARDFGAARLRSLIQLCPDQVRIGGHRFRVDRDALELAARKARLR